MNRRVLIVCVCAAWGVAGAKAQDQRQATITGRGGSPKCTIEVEVDGAVDVEIRGTMGRLHTLQGAAGVWRRFECNQPMPLNPEGFRFTGIDGRGRQTLVRDPRGNGAAVVRLEDPKSGREGYTFDLEWRGGGYQDGPGGGGPYPPPGRPDGGRPGYGRFSSIDAIHQCGEAAEAQLRQNGYRETRVQNANLGDQPGRRQRVYGDISGRRGPDIFDFRFSCPVDIDAGRVGPVNVRPRR